VWGLIGAVQSSDASVSSDEEDGENECVRDGFVVSDDEATPEQASDTAAVYRCVHFVLFGLCVELTGLHKEWR
jgi:hypothetical protein